MGLGGGSLSNSGPPGANERALSTAYFFLSHPRRTRSASASLFATSNRGDDTRIRELSHKVKTVTSVFLCYDTDIVQINIYVRHRIGLVLRLWTHQQLLNCIYQKSMAHAEETPYSSPPPNCTLHQASNPSRPLDS